MSEPSISVFMSTQGRPSINRTLHSIKTQRLLPEDEVLIMGDGPVESVKELCENLGPPFKYIEGPTTNTYGHAQCNLLLKQLKGDIIVGQDDDDIFTPRAFEVIRKRWMEQPSGLHMFRFWRDPWIFPTSASIEDSQKDGHCVVVGQGTQGHFNENHAGDQQYIRECYEKNNKEVHFHREIIGLAAPTIRLWEWPVTTNQQVEELRQLHNLLAPYFAHTKYDETTNLPIDITFNEQVEWWDSLDHSKNWAYLLTVGPTGPYIGFFYIRRDATDRMVVSAGLHPSVWGHKLGYDMILLYLLACHEDVYGDALESHAAICHMNKKMGWREISRKDGIIDLYRPYPSHGSSTF